MSTRTGTFSALGARLASGEEHALEECYARYGCRLLGYLARVVGPLEAEDVLQRVFLDVWRSARRFDASRNLDAWLFEIARRRAIDHLRRRRSDLPLEAAAHVVGEDGRDVAERQARREWIRLAMSTLPEPQRRVLHLAFYDGLPQPEIAVHLQAPLGTVKARMYRGLRRLSRELQAHAVPDEAA